MERIFGLDLRAVAVLRILLALLLLVSIAERLRDFSAFYTDAGVLSQAEAWTGSWFVPWDGASALHPFVWLPDPWSSAALFLSATTAAVLLLLGRHTKPATFVAWLMLSGIDNRNPLVINAGDDALRLFLFWSLFLPSSYPRRQSNRLLSFGTAAFVTQLALIYFISALIKSYRYWVTDGDAIHYALHLEQFVTPLGIALRDHLPTQLLSRATWSLELVGPLLMFSPFATDGLRMLLFVAFTALHVGIEATLGLGLFSYVCIAAWVVTLPTSFWDWAERLVARQGRAAMPGGSAARRDPLASNLVAGSFLVYVLLWNLWSLDPAKHERWFPRDVRSVGYQLRLGQLWGMFSPGPPKESSWLELGARTSDGTVHWLRPDGRVSDESPATPERLLSERWRKFHERLVQTHPSILDERYGAFLLKRFELSHPDAPARVTIVWVKRPSPGRISSNQPEKRDEATLLATAGLQLDQPPPRWSPPSSSL